MQIGSQKSTSYFMSASTDRREDSTSERSARALSATEKARDDRRHSKVGEIKITFNETEL